ncbi:hypothetical protein [Chitinophaga arvensicola]|uniref:Uncharacterized protein n=1 Tax=Chitinophaga arvensicola TaxID=29529 RepID=A0A1I0QSK6_9BACT|nr:hypothetical protein [Chitinophaga arvensicola]SEW30551.1 hypothetical protein SAMN04488122_1713 [Chitinophaga arvensicola]
MRNEFGRRKGAHVLKFILLGAVFVVAVGFVTMTLWNCLIPELFHGPVITFWQALGLLLLGKLLFGWNSHHDKFNRGREWKARMKEKLSNMTPEEQEKMREHFRNRCGTGFGGWRREQGNRDTDQPKNEEKESL